MNYAGLSWTAGARKHKITRDQVRHVIAHAGVMYVRAADPPDRPDEGILFVGDDGDGSAIEIVGVELADGRLRIIHAMPMRAGYQMLNEKARRWRQ